MTADKAPAARRRGRARTPGAARLAALEMPVASRLRQAGAVQALAGALWPVQAAAVALAVAGWLQDAALRATLLAAAVFAVVGLLRAGLDALAGGIAFRAADRALASERGRLLGRESLRAGAGPASAEVAALMAQKLPLLVPYLTRYRPAAMRVVVVPLVLLLVAGWISWTAAAIFAITGPLIPVFMALVGMAAKEASARQLAEIGTMNGLLIDRLAALLDIRLLDASGRTARDFAARAEALRARTMAVLRIAFLSSSVLELFAAIGVAMMALYVGFSLLGILHFGMWGRPMTVAQGIFLLLIAPEVYQPLRDLAAAWHDRAAAQALAEELAAAEAAPGRSVPGKGSRVAPLPGPATVRLRGLVAARGAEGGAGLALPDLDLAPGQALAVTGPSGAGKSTLLTLVAGLEAPAAGRIEVAGTGLSAETADAWRARLAWVGQTVHFLDMSLAANLDLCRGGAGIGGAPADRAGALQDALVAARAEAVVAALPGGLDARLGETGGGISGGEARRLMLARAFAAAPDLLLADEPTADLDPETAAAVTASLLELNRRGTSLIVATHDRALVAALGRELALPAQPDPSEGAE